MKKVKLIVVNLIFVLSLFVFPVITIANSVPDAPKDFYLDNLNMLDQATKDNITNTNKELEKKTGSQVVVATIKNEDSLPIADIAVEIFNKWKIGDEKKNNGALILITEDDSTGKREVYISTGYGIEGRLNDGKVGRIIDSFMLESLKAGDYSKALNEGFNAVVAEIADEYEVKLDGNYENYLTENTGSQGAAALLIMVIIFIFFLIFINSFLKTVFDTSLLGLFSRDKRHSKKSYRSTYKNSYDNGFDDDDDDYSSSSYDNDSFGGFSGGGGSTGGGGAGRSF